MGPDGRIMKRIEFRCPDDMEACRIAEGTVDGHAVELWQAGRFIRRFDPQTSRIFSARYIK
jgi:hypothetical protein